MQSVIICDKHGVYELPNDLRLRILGYWKDQENLKTS